MKAATRKSQAASGLLLTLCTLFTFSCQLPFSTGFNNPVDPEVAALNDAARDLPATPTGLSATPANNQVTLSWQAVSNASSYKVFYKAGSTATSDDTRATEAMLNGTTAIIPSLLNYSQYAFIVVASNANGDSPASQIITCTPLPLPAAPTGVTATVGNTSISLSWNAVASALSYTVYYRAGATASTSDTAATAGMISGTSATITGLTNLTGYAFIVVASNDAGDSPASTVVTCTPLPSPTAPTSVNFSGYHNRITLNWPAVSGAASYNIYWSTISGQGTSGTKISNVTSPYNHTGRTDGVPYYYVVTSVNALGESAASTQLTGTANYAIGETGPGGGLIFYVNTTGFTVGGSTCHFLEAAPSDQGYTRAVWEGNKSIATATTIGSGKANTTAINTANIGAANETTYAAYLCKNYSGGGLTDWFLPSQAELLLAYDNLKENGWGSFITSGTYSIYWTSSASSNTQAYYVYFSDRSTGAAASSGAYSVRAIRAF